MSEVPKEIKIKRKFPKKSWLKKKGDYSRKNWINDEDDSQSEAEKEDEDREPKKPETFEEAVKFLDETSIYWEKFNWSIRYYGVGEHFTFWAGFGGFIDWNFDNGTAISWKEMKKVIIDSAQHLYDEFNNKTKDEEE